MGCGFFGLPGPMPRGGLLRVYCVDFVSLGAGEFFGSRVGMLVYFVSEPVVRL